MNISMDEERLKMNLAKNIRFLRLTNNPRITQAELAKKLGITQKSISNYEQARCLPPTYVLAAIADLFHLSLDDLLSPLPGKKGRVQTNENLTYNHQKTDHGYQKQINR